METLTLPAKMENFERLIEFVRRGAESAGFDPKTVNKINLALEEALVNIIKYAYPGSAGDVQVNLEIGTEGHGLEISLVDWGVQFNPLARPDPDLNVPVKDRPIGGLGIFMIRKIMDELEYRRDGGKNVLIMKKN